MGDDISGVPERGGTSSPTSKYSTMSTVTLDTTVVACKDQVSADLASEMVILNLKNGEYYGLNDVGARIWALLQEPRTLAAVRDQVVSEYEDADPDVCGQELLDLAEELAKVGLIEVVPSSVS